MQRPSDSLVRKQHSHSKPIISPNIYAGDLRVKLRNIEKYWEYCELFRNIENISTNIYPGDLRLRAQLRKKKNHQKSHRAPAPIPHSSQGEMSNHEEKNQIKIKLQNLSPAYRMKCWRTLRKAIRKKTTEFCERKKFTNGGRGIFFVIMSFQVKWPYPSGKWSLWKAGGACSQNAWLVGCTNICICICTQIYLHFYKYLYLHLPKSAWFGINGKQTFSILLKGPSHVK